jgi:hypothetical protein
MTEREENPKRYDLEERTFAFAQRVRMFVRRSRGTGEDLLVDPAQE